MTGRIDRFIQFSGRFKSSHQKLFIVILTKRIRFQTFLNEKQLEKEFYGLLKKIKRIPC
jgi:hypothetical protein